MKDQKGFSLVELLVVVIIIAIIAAIAIPNLLASRRSANEASAVSSLRTIHSAEATYQTLYGNNTNYGDLSDLGTNKLVDPVLGGSDTTDKSGYRFNVVNSTAQFYCGTGKATSQGVTGTRSFAVSQAGVIYSATDGSIACDATTGIITGTGATPIQ